LGCLLFAADLLLRTRRNHDNSCVVITDKWGKKMLLDA
jgi:hypothetical protein